MKGITKSKHLHLINALVQLEDILKTKAQERSCFQQNADYRADLESLYRQYEKQLANLSLLIADYDCLFTEIKTKYIGKKLKELRKEIPHQEPVFVMLAKNIRKIYGS